MIFQNGQDLMEKVIIPIGSIDLKGASDPQNCQSDFWFIAVQGQRDEEKIEGFSWKVLVFETNCAEDIELKIPHMSSRSYDTFQEACDAAVEFEHIDDSALFSTT